MTVNSEGRAFLFFMFLFLIIVSLGTYAIVFYHEVVHQTIFDSYGVESEIVFYNPLDFSTPVASTRSLSNCNDLEYDCGDMRLLHGFNEVVGYQLEAFFIALSVVGLGLVVYLREAIVK